MFDKKKKMKIDSMINDSMINEIPVANADQWVSSYLVPLMLMDVKCIAHH